MSLEQRAAELETRVPASECFIIEVKIRRTAPPSLGCWHSVATPWLKRVIASQCLVSFQEIFAFMNKKNLRQYIYKVTFHLYSNSNMFVFYIIFIVPVSTGDRNCSIFVRTSSTVLARSRTKWPTTCMSCSQSPWTTWKLAWWCPWTVTTRRALTWHVAERKHVLFCFFALKIPNLTELVQLTLFYPWLSYCLQWSPLLPYYNQIFIHSLFTA